MGRGLFEHDPVFQKIIRDCDDAFRALSGISIIGEFMASETTSRLDQTMFAQPATFALQLGLAARWKGWGIVPGAVIGHSIGEMAAACVSGALTFDDAVRVVHHRSRLQEHVRAHGGMAAIGLPAKEVAKILEETGCGIEIAAINAPELVTLAGSKRELERLLAELAVSRRDLFTRILNVDTVIAVPNDPIPGDLGFASFVPDMDAIERVSHDQVVRRADRRSGAVFTL